MSRSSIGSRAELCGFHADQPRGRAGARSSCDSFCGARTGYHDPRTESHAAEARCGKSENTRAARGVPAAATICKRASSGGSQAPLPIPQAREGKFKPTNLTTHQFWYNCVVPTRTEHSPSGGRFMPLDGTRLAEMGCLCRTLDERGAGRMERAAARRPDASCLS
jgi:hypothetical protein